MLQEKVSTLLTGGVSMLAITAADNISLPAPEDIQNYGQLIIQLIVGIVTIIKMLKKPKNPNNNEGVN